MVRAFPFLSVLFYGDRKNKSENPADKKSIFLKNISQFNWTDQKRDNQNLEPFLAKKNRNETKSKKNLEN